MMFTRAALPVIGVSHILQLQSSAVRGSTVPNDFFLACVSDRGGEMQKVNSSAQAFGAGVTVLGCCASV